MTDKLTIEAPDRSELKAGVKGVFLAGGITGCPNWQGEVIKFYGSIGNLVFFNPRRKDFPMDDPDAMMEQIEWEYDYLRKADAILFWFPWETVCPIALYELGAWSMTDKPIFVGVHPLYRRRRDVEIQTELARPEMVVVYSLLDLRAQVAAWMQGGD